MIINKAYFVGVTISPPKDQSPLIINPYAIKPLPIASQYLKPVAWRRSQINKLVARVQYVELPQSGLFKVTGETPYPTSQAIME